MLNAWPEKKHGALLQVTLKGSGKFSQDELT